MSNLSLGAAALLALASAGCHSEQTRDKIANLEGDQAAQPAAPANEAEPGNAAE